MKITKRQLKAALTAAYEAGFNSGFECTDARWVEHNFGNNPDDPHWRGGMDELIQDRDKVVKRIAKHEAKHAKMRKLKNVRKHWNVNNKAASFMVRGELGAGKSATLPDLLAEYDSEGQQFLDDYPRAAAAAQLELGELYRDGGQDDEG